MPTYTWRPATPEEAHEDIAKRWAAIGAAGAAGILSDEQLEDARLVMDTFNGYARPVFETD